MLRRLLATAAVAAAALAAAGVATAATEHTGEIAGAPYAVLEPDAWNGTLVVLAHGYRDKADGPGEVDDRRPLDDVFRALAEGLAAQGYAVAASAYADNGWAVKEGIRDTVIVRLVAAALVGKPDTALLVGFSMGSVVTAALAESVPDLFDGYLPACAVVAGAPRAWDGAAAHLLAYHAAFGMPAGWGSPADVRDDLDFHTEVFSKLALVDPGDPQYFAKTEFIRLVTQVAGPSSPLPPGWLPNGFFTNMYFLTEARAELERRARGAPVQNLDHAYALAPADYAYLQAVGLPPAQVDAMLAQMNGTRFSGPRHARLYLKAFADFRGRIKEPVLTLHTTIDTLVPPAHESAYAATVGSAGRSDLLAQAYADRNGHCNFEPAQVGYAIAALESWAKGGPKPASFPAALGFTPFAPPAWPFG